MAFGIALWALYSESVDAGDKQETKQSDLRNLNMVHSLN